MPGLELTPGQRHHALCHTFIATCFSASGYEKVKVILSSRKGFKTTYKLKSVEYMGISSKEGAAKELRVDAKKFCTVANEKKLH